VVVVVVVLRAPPRSLVRDLKKESLDSRKWIVRAAHDPGTHIGGSLSAIDVLTALYHHFLRVDPKRPDWPDRDRFILSKGHVAYALYIVLAKRGFITFEELKLYDRPGNFLGTHPSRKLPGVDLSTGSLGHGLSVGAGMALVGKREKKTYRVYTMVGDGELQEGSIYEAAMSASKYKLDNLVVIVDRNMIQVDYTEKIMPLGDIEPKWSAFGWATRVIDGHDMQQIVDTFGNLPAEKDKPTAIIANTIKGKGVRFIQGTPASHIVRFTEEERDRALKELLMEEEEEEEPS
jgi:transketolase